jgi:predicted nucleotidyltransferase
VDKTAAPPLLPIFRSRQQAELLAYVLGQPPDAEVSLTELSRRLAMPYPSVHREVERAATAGIVRSRKIGNTRLVQADPTSPYHRPLAELLERAFGVPWVIGAALQPVDGIVSAHVYGSWAASHAGQVPDRPIGDIDLLVLGEPDRDELYAVLAALEDRLGRPVQVTIRPADWFEHGDGAFHDTVTSRPLVDVPLVTASSAV